MNRLAMVSILAVLAMACGTETSSAPWLTDPGVDGHAPYLLLAGTPHDPTAPGSTVSCDSCHPSTTFKVFDCTGCHTAAVTDPLHTGISGYPSPGTVTSADCYRCHPQGLGAMTPAQHATYFTIGTTSHPAVCTHCHSDPVNKQDLTKLACVTCHATTPTSSGAAFSTAHGKVKDYPVSPTPEWCLRCHADDQVNPIASHGRQPGPQGSPGSAGPGDGNHDTHCFTCHTMVPPLPLFGGPGPGIAGRPWAEDWSVATCSLCH